MLEPALVESLRCHMEVLYLQLFDPLPLHSVHLSHVNQFIIDFVDAARLPAFLG